MAPRRFAQTDSLRVLRLKPAFLLLAASLLACRNPPPRSPPPEVPIVLIPAWAVKVRPRLGAISRAEYEKDLLGPPHQVDAAAFAANLTKALNAVERFTTTQDEWTTYTNDWDVRRTDVVDLMILTLDRMETSGATNPEFLLTEDLMGYPRFHAVWQGNDRHRVATLNDNNDNDSIIWRVGSGRFAVRHNDTLKESLTRKQFLERIAATFEKGKTIYPHIELYSVCLPVCD